MSFKGHVESVELVYHSTLVVNSVEANVIAGACAATHPIPRSGGQNTMACLFMQGPTTFHLAASRKAESLSLLQNYYDRKVPHGEREDEDHVAPLGCLEEGLFTLGWEAVADCEGNVTGLTYTGKYYTAEGDALEAIASCVTAGSSIVVVIEHEGQLGFDVERWLFDGVRLHRIEANISFAALPDRNPAVKNTPHLLTGIQQGLALSLQYFLVLLTRDPELVRAFEQQFLLECLLAETHIPQETGRDGQVRRLLGALSATINHLLEAADSGE